MHFGLLLSWKQVLLIKISLIWFHSVCNIGHQSTSSDKLTYANNIIAVNGGKMVKNVSCEPAEGFLPHLHVCKASSDQVSHTGSYSPLVVFVNLLFYIRYVQFGAYNVMYIVKVTGL